MVAFCQDTRQEPNKLCYVRLTMAHELSILSKNENVSLFKLSYIVHYLTDNLDTVHYLTDYLQHIELTLMLIKVQICCIFCVLTFSLINTLC